MGSPFSCRSKAKSALFGGNFIRAISNDYQNNVAIGYRPILKVILILIRRQNMV